MSWLFAALSGLMLFVATPPMDLSFIAWIGLVPLWVSLERPLGNGFGEGFVAGAVFNTLLLGWLAFNRGTHPAVAFITAIAAAGILAVGWGCGSWIFRRLRERFGRAAWMVVPFSWAAWEGLLSNLGELAFPWPLLALTQNGFEAALQVMEFTGVWGVSFWVVALNLAVWFIWLGKSRREKRWATAAFIVLILIPPLALNHAYGYYEQKYPTVRAAVVQGNLDPLGKWLSGAATSWSIYDSLTRRAFELKPQLVVWPETAIPSYIAVQSQVARNVQVLARDGAIAILTGASGYARLNGEVRGLNSAFLITGDRGLRDVYSKRQLVPFGERVPFQWLMPSLGSLNLGQAEFLPGLRQTIFEAQLNGEWAKFPALICFESVFPAVTRLAALSGANFLVTISNDAWYGPFNEQAQIAALSRFRCIETRRAMARASNSGISFLSDPLGRIIAETGLDRMDYAGAELPLVDHKTFYVRHGDLFLAIVTIIYGLTLIGAFFIHPKPDPESSHKNIIHQGTVEYSHRH